MLYVDFVKGHFINFEIDVTALSDAVLADWLVDKDTVEADVQVDGKTVHSVVVTRDLRAPTERSGCSSWWIALERIFSKSSKTGKRFTSAITSIVGPMGTDF